jgi:hypothetical protein
LKLKLRFGWRGGGRLLLISTIDVAFVANWTWIFIDTSSFAHQRRLLDFGFILSAFREGFYFSINIIVCIRGTPFSTSLITFCYYNNLLLWTYRHC